MNKQDLINRIVDELWDRGLTVQDIDISEYEQAISEAIKE